MTPLETAQFGVAVVALLAAVWGFYSGWLPRWMREQIGYYDLKADVEQVRENTQTLRNDHEETMAKLDTLEQGQMHIAKSVSDEHGNVDMDWFDDNLDVDHPRGRPTDDD